MDKKALFKKFNKSMDIEGLAKDVDEYEKNGGGDRNYEDVPLGDYEVAVDKLELGESKKGSLMVTIWFKIVSDGKYKNSRIFMNQVITQPFQISIVNGILRSLVKESEIAPQDIHFESLEQYDELLMDIFEAIDGQFEYALRYDENKKGYHTFEILEVYPL